MEFFISVILGAFIGYLINRKKVEQKLFIILSKSGWFDEKRLGEFMAYYKNYDKIQKEVNKTMRDNALRLETEYRLKCDDKSKRL